MKQFWKHALRVVAFVAGLIVILLAVSVVMTPKNNTERAGILSERAYGFLAEPENSLDVLFLGDSEGYRAFGYVGLALDGGQDTRLSGYADALNRAGYALNESHILRIDVHAPEPDAAWDAFVQRLPRPAAVFCFHDLLAVNLLETSQRQKGGKS